MMPMVCVDAVAILFLFDLTNRVTLTNVREWYKQVRGLNKVRRARGASAQTAIALLIGTKYDLFAAQDSAEREETNRQARRYARAMKAPLIYCSSQSGINVPRMFKLVFCKVFDVPPNMAAVDNDEEPIFLLDAPDAAPAPA